MTPQPPSDFINDSPAAPPETDIENRDAENAQDAESKTASAVRYVLAAAWVLVPAIQYLGTYQRTSLQLEGQAMFPSLADLDLTSCYLFLLAATVIYLLVQWAASRRRQDGSNEAEEVGDARRDQPAL